MHPLADTYAQATQKTALDLKTIATSLQFMPVSRLSLPEIEHLSEEIARVVPAGNVPGLILGGLARLQGRQISSAEHQQNIGLLFRGVRDLLDKAVFATMFAGPAAVLMGYQNLLKLAGRDLDGAFPDGAWQFYLEFALREDSARHANETVGFQSSLAAHRVVLSEADQLTAWVMAVLMTLHHYDRLLVNEWRERVHIALLKQVVDAAGMETATAVHRACGEWDRLRPYTRGRDAGNDDYPAYRRRIFDDFFQSIVSPLAYPVQAAFKKTVEDAEWEALPRYRQQMSIFARLEPDTYQEKRVPYALHEASIALIVRGHYFLLPVNGSTSVVTMPNVHTIRSSISDLLQKAVVEPPGDLDLLLVDAHREAQSSIRSKLDKAVQQSIRRLSNAPVVINWDRVTESIPPPLAAVRRGRRGIGDHALTLFFTNESTVFDQSHIFFDGAWGAALAEIMTNEALAWAIYLAQLPAPAPIDAAPQRLPLTVNEDAAALAARARLSSEAWAENNGIRLGSVQALRRLFKARNDLVNVTVNDLLVLYRCICGQRYQPSPRLIHELEQLRADPRNGVSETYAGIMAAIKKIQQGNPALLIPMDGSLTSPKERVYPTTFRNPFMDVLAQHDAALAALHAYKNAGGERTSVYKTIDECQRAYLRLIASFGVLLRRYKEIAISGQSTSTTSIKMLANMPDTLKYLLDQIPGRIDVLNEVVKGEEVFSNVGRVAQGSSVRRFITAKDDNEQKTLAWGVITDNYDVVHITLRDFRPHVSVLTEYKMQSLTHFIAQDFLDSYVDGFNHFVNELREITLASRETKAQRTATDPTNRRERD